MFPASFRATLRLVQMASIRELPVVMVVEGLEFFPGGSGAVRNVTDSHVIVVGSVVTNINQAKPCGCEESSGASCRAGSMRCSRPITGIASRDCSKVEKTAAAESALISDHALMRH